MNNQLLEKVIKSNSDTCPPFTYDNPLLDRNIAGALSRSLVKILQVSRENCNINSNLKLSVLENIKKICRIEPEKHIQVNEKFTELLTETYQKNFKDSVQNTRGKVLDAFLLRKMKGGVQPCFETSLNPETVQALINLSDNGTHTGSLSEEVIHCNADSLKCRSLLKNLWTNKNYVDSLSSKTTMDDLSIKMKPEIERVILENCCKVLECNNVNIEEMFTCNSSLSHLMKTSAISPQCFQICCSVLNFLFITINFDIKIQTFICTFVNYVKLHCLSVSFSTLYPTQLSSIVLLLDIDLNEFPISTKNNYITMTNKHLEKLHTENENHLIMLLSHFPDWFDFYFTKDILLNEIVSS